LSRGGPFPAARLASGAAIVYQAVMVTRTEASKVSRSAFAGETVRALFSTLLLLGLSGDRRAR
jgi:hypothetical protein